MTNLTDSLTFNQMCLKSFHMESSSRTSRLRPRKQRKADSKNTEPEKRGVNTSGLAILPDELLLDIVSYLPSLPAPSESHASSEDAMAYAQQRDLFLALSISCRHLRRFFRPYIWRRLEVTSGMRIGETILHPQSGKEGDVAYATELVRQLEIVTIRDPSLAEYVQYVLTRNEFWAINLFPIYMQNSQFRDNRFLDKLSPC